MKCSSVTLEEAIKLVDPLLYVKITFNGKVIYNDYDDDEYKSPYAVIPERIAHYRNSIVESIEVDIVEFHHTVIHMHGQLVEE